MNKKILLGIFSILVIILLAYFTSSIKPIANEENNKPYIPLAEDIGNENPAIEENVINQPAYLIDAYSKNGNNYIDVDYVEWLHGDAGIQAQVEDGECPNTTECWIYPNGHKRNRDPKIRTFEVSPNVSIEIKGDMASELIGTTAPQKTLVIPFNKMEEIVSKRKTFIESNPNPEIQIAFITIDVENNKIVRIFQPYQE